MLTVLLLALSPFAQSPSVPEPARDFDFWAGEWTVQNRHLGANGVWNDGTQTRARITPVLDGAALLEEWAGTFGNGFMNGFSLRSYDPAQKLWTIILFWTTDGNSSFGKMQGTFRHGRGEFLSPLNPTPGQGNVTRYTFSDGLAQSVRWDQANSLDGGLTWKTDWIMEFTRTAPASKATETALSVKPWNAGALSPHVEARQLDWLRGSWAGTEIRYRYQEAREATLTCSLLDKDCLLLMQGSSGYFGEEDWDQNLQIRGYVAANQRWEAWQLTEDDPVMRSSIGVKTENGFTFTTSFPEGGEQRETITRVDHNHLLWTLHKKDSADGKERMMWSRELTRDV